MREFPSEKPAGTHRPVLVPRVEHGYVICDTCEVQINVCLGDLEWALAAMTAFFKKHKKCGRGQANRAEWALTRKAGLKKVVYPGHPLTLAWYVMESFASLAEAVVPYAGINGYTCPAALTCSAIPGAGGCVYAALGLLQSGKTPEEMVVMATEMWHTHRRTDHADKIPAGDAEAAHMAPLFIAKAREWFASKPAEVDEP